MCGRNVSLLSRVTPRVLTVSESGTAVPARSMLESKRKVSRRCHEPNKNEPNKTVSNCYPPRQQTYHRSSHTGNLSRLTLGKVQASYQPTTSTLWTVSNCYPLRHLRQHRGRIERQTYS